MTEMTALVARVAPEIVLFSFTDLVFSSNNANNFGHDIHTHSSTRSSLMLFDQAMSLTSVSVMTRTRSDHVTTKPSNTVAIFGEVG